MLCGDLTLPCSNCNHLCLVDYLVRHKTSFFCYKINDYQDTWLKCHNTLALQRDTSQYSSRGLAQLNNTSIRQISGTHSRSR